MGLYKGWVVNLEDIILPGLPHLTSHVRQTIVRKSQYSDSSYLILSFISICATTKAASRSFSSSAARNSKVLAILYKGNDAARQEPRLLGTVENEVSACIT